MSTELPLVLAGRHVRLAPLEIGHARPLLAAATEDRSTYGWTYVPEDLPGMLAYVETALEERARGESIPFVVLDASGRVVGSTRYMCIERWRWRGPAAEPVPNGPDVVEIGTTWYAASAQRTAINTEAKLLLLGHAFDAWRVRKVVLRTDANNARSRAAIERIGARFEGVLRAHRPSSRPATVRDTACYGMLPEEWPPARRRLEERLRSS